MQNSKQLQTLKMINYRWLQTGPGDSMSYSCSCAQAYVGHVNGGVAHFCKCAIPFTRLRQEFSNVGYDTCGASVEVHQDDLGDTFAAIYTDGNLIKGIKDPPRALVMAGRVPISRGRRAPYQLHSFVMTVGPLILVTGVMPRGNDSVILKPAFVSVSQRLFSYRAVQGLVPETMTPMLLPGVVDSRFYNHGIPSPMYEKLEATAIAFTKRPYRDDQANNDVVITRAYANMRNQAAFIMQAASMVTNKDIVYGGGWGANPRYLGEWKLKKNFFHSFVADMFRLYAFPYYKMQEDENDVEILDYRKTLRQLSKCFTELGLVTFSVVNPSKHKGKWYTNPRYPSVHFKMI